MFNRVKSRISLFFCICLVLAYAVVPASAAMDASGVISSHSCEVTATGGGEIDVEFAISAKSVVSRIGANYMYFMYIMAAVGRWRNPMARTILE